MQEVQIPEDIEVKEEEEADSEVEDIEKETRPTLISLPEKK